MPRPPDATLLFTAGAIAARIDEMARRINADLAGGDQPLHCIVLLNGAMLFAADLVRRLDLPVELDSAAVSSYSGRSSTGELRFRAAPKMPVAGRRILLIDDILDSGRTLQGVIRHLQAQGAADIRTAVLLDKPARRVPEGLPCADYTGFTIPDAFVVGYGLDCDEAWRQLPEIFALKA